MTARKIPPFRRAMGGAPRVTYRADIDGLRAIAVLSVVTFHAAPSALRGGFVGVDVFFVISGFLITAILLDDGDGPSALRAFYARRVKRIFPALALVLSTTAVLAWFILLAGEYAAFGKHLIGGASFSSNFVLQGEAGYFDVTAERKPLLHLWSLAVEEQFYLLFPLALVAARRRRFDVGVLVAVIAAASFVTSLLANGPGAFYSPLTRFWELMIGALLAHRAKTRRYPFGETPRPARERTLLASFGLLVLGTSMVVLTSKQPLPAGWALAPTLGTAALIAAGHDAWPNQRLLALPLLAWIGRISFPLYLWHWPLLSLLRVAASGPPSPYGRLVAVGASVALAWLTHAAIERPLRASRRVTLETSVLCAALVGIGVFGFVAFRSGGFPGRAVVALNPFQLPEREPDFDPATKPGCLVPDDQRRLFESCRTDARERPTVALVGDSKARALFNAFVKESDASTRVVMISGGGFRGIVPVLSEAPGYRHYSALATIASDAVDADTGVRVVVLVAAIRLLFGLEHDDTLEELPGSANAGIAFAGLDRMITKLIAAGKVVLVVVDNPTLPDPADCVSRATALPFLNDALALRPRRIDCTISYARQMQLSKPYRDVIDALKAKHAGLLVFDTLDVLCEGRRSCSAADAQGRVLYSYSDHVSELGGSLIAHALWPMLREAVRPPGR